MKTTKTLFGILTLALSAATAHAGFSFCTTNGAYATIPYNSSMNLANNALTVECWFNRQGLPSTWDDLVSEQSDSLTFSGWDLRFAGLIPRGSINTTIQNEGVDLADTAGSGEPASNEWHHYAMQFDGTNYLVWMDGQSIFSTNIVGQIIGSANPISIGCQSDGFRPFYGFIAEVHVSNIGRYYTPFIPQTRFAADSNTIALYHFDAGQGTTVTDSSGNGNNGTIQGTGAWSTVVPNVANVSLQEAVMPTFSNLILTTNYQLQVSTDLNTWTNQGSPFMATNTSMVYPQFFNVSNWNQLFFRLQSVP